MERSANTTQGLGRLSTAGFSAVKALVFVALLAAIAIGAVLFFGRREPAAQAPATPTAAPEHVHVEGFEGRVELGLPRASPAVDVYPADLFGGARFEGTGQMTVFAFAKDAAFPQHWSLVLEPSKVLMGGDTARGRTVALDAGERQVELSDVPLGGYDLRGVAPGLCTQVQQVLLAKPDETHAVVHVEFFPAGYLTGRVVDTKGKPIDELEVVLEDVKTRARTSVRTDPIGVYLFESVLDGEYRLFAASVDSPLAPGKELIFAAPSMHMADVVVPELGELVVRVVDRHGNPVAGARLEGYGSAGGRVSGETDADGRALARHVARGSATVIATAPDGSQGRDRIDVAPGARVELTVRLRE